MMKCALFVLVCLLTLSLPPAEAQMKESSTVSIGPAKFHEDCASLSKGGTMDYSFEATGPLDFNIHFHVGNDIREPVKKKGTTRDSGTFVADGDEVYCLMWTNPNSEAIRPTYIFSVPGK